MKWSKKKKEFVFRFLTLQILIPFLVGFFGGRIITHLVESNRAKEVEISVEIADTTPTVVTSEPTKEFVSYYTYTEEELDLLARLIHAEGSTESYDTKLRIGSVVMNRVESSNFPDTIEEVIYEKSQFSVTTLKVDGVPMIDQPADEESFRAAKEILDYGSVLPEDVQVFYTDWCTEPWVTSRKTYLASDSTVFAYYYKGE